MQLSPLPIQKFFNNNGAPMAGGLLYTYAAGTSDKIATYKDAAGEEENTNPIELDFRGECRLWLDPALAYKFVLSPPGDTDPPTNPIWTVDDVTAGAGEANPNPLIATITGTEVDVATEAVLFEAAVPAGRLAMNGEETPFLRIKCGIDVNSIGDSGNSIELRLIDAVSETALHTITIANPIQVGHLVAEFVVRYVAPTVVRSFATALYPDDRSFTDVRFGSPAGDPDGELSYQVTMVITGTGDRTAIPYLATFEVIG